jgi:hypothetical protein
MLRRPLLFLPAGGRKRSEGDRDFWCRRETFVKFWCYLGGNDGMTFFAGTGVGSVTIGVAPSFDEQPSKGESYGDGNHCD